MLEFSSEIIDQEYDNFENKLKFQFSKLKIVSQKNDVYIGVNGITGVNI